MRPGHRFERRKQVSTGAPTFAYCLCSLRKELREGERRGPAKGGEVHAMANWVSEALSESWIDPGDLPLRCD